MIYHILWKHFLKNGIVVSFYSDLNYRETHDKNLERIITDIHHNNERISSLVHISLQVYNIFTDEVLVNTHDVNDSDRNYEIITNIIQRIIPEFQLEVSTLDNIKEIMCEPETSIPEDHYKTRMLEMVNILKKTKYTFDKSRCIQDNPKDMRTNTGEKYNKRPTIEGPKIKRMPTVTKPKPKRKNTRGIKKSSSVPIITAQPQLSINTELQVSNPMLHTPSITYGKEGPVTGKPQLPLYLLPPPQPQQPPAPPPSNGSQITRSITTNGENSERIIPPHPPPPVLFKIGHNGGYIKKRRTFKKYGKNKIHTPEKKI